MWTKHDVLTNSVCLDLAIDQTFDFLAKHYGVERRTIEANFEDTPNMQARFREMLDCAAEGIAKGLNDKSLNVD